MTAVILRVGSLEYILKILNMSAGLFGRSRNLRHTEDTDPSIMPSDLFIMVFEWKAARLEPDSLFLRA